MIGLLGRMVQIKQTYAHDSAQLPSLLPRYGLNKAHRLGLSTRVERIVPESQCSPQVCMPRDNNLGGKSEQVWRITDDEATLPTGSSITGPVGGYDGGLCSFGVFWKSQGRMPVYSRQGRVKRRRKGWDAERGSLRSDTVPHNRNESEER